MADADVVRFVGHPDGDKVFIPELGCKVGTFTQVPGGRRDALMHHVPLKQRGEFRPEDLANYDSQRQYRTESNGYLLCYAKTTANAKCKRKAVNRFPRCDTHGGRLHPLDKLITETGEPETEEPLSRYQQYVAGQISVEDLDDEEVMGLGFRNAKGRIYKPKNVSREMVTAFTKAIFDRSLDKLKSSALEAANTLASIMVDDQVDANIRLKAATEILDRTLGKAPQLVNIQTNAPWEQIYEGIATLSRDESRRTRGEIVDAEVVADQDTQPALPVGHESTWNPSLSDNQTP